jgi:2-hydroxychromene-2-carboxylate isomerase
MIRTDYKENLSKYTGKVDDGKLQSIIKFCGIALKGTDSQYVSMTDDAEIMRVANGFAAKKLGLDEAATRAGLKKVAEAMKAEKTKMRTTVYYLLAENTNTLSKLG